ncbi:MAG TPA: 3'-5' exonuclease [Gemmatimonadota bacterium]|jgi:DNA polymerase-3 subunit epsilon|nr:3'-5' exonuclease [Gemmatimonadota bacterium]
MSPLARQGALRSRARAFLAGRGPVPAVALAREVLALERVGERVAEQLLETLLAGDAAFTRAGTAWRLSPTSPPRPCALAELPLVVVDVETTGGRPPGDRITEIGAVSLVGGTIVDEWSALVNPGRSIPWFVQRLTGIDDHLVSEASTFDGVADEFLSFLGGRTFVAHNAHFDWRFVNAELLRARSGTLANPRLCTVRLARALLPHVRRRSLDALAWLFGITIEGRHRALGDARGTARILLHLLEVADERGARTEADLIGLAGHPGTLFPPRPYEAG